MAEQITFEHLGPDDLERLQSVADGLFDNPIRPDQARAFLNDPLHELIITFAGDIAVGMITATVLMHPDKAPSMFINELGVREEYQRRGIATELTNRMLAVARNRNCEGVWLGTEEDNDGALLSTALRARTRFGAASLVGTMHCNIDR